MNYLDLYARIEPLIGFYEEYQGLYNKYLDIIEPLGVKKILDIGSGNGKFLQRLRDEEYEAFGIERSAKMVEIASSIGVKSEVKELSELKSNSYDAITAIGDVLNYISLSELNEFFLQVKRVLKPQGYFIADVNTFEGFEIADGVMSSSLEDKFLSIEANYVDEVLHTHISYFEKEGKAYQRYEAGIDQYYHSRSYFETQSSLQLKDSLLHNMFSELDEKEIMLFQKV